MLDTSPQSLGPQILRSHSGEPLQHVHTEMLIEHYLCSLLAANVPRTNWTAGAIRV